MELKFDVMTYRAVADEHGNKYLIDRDGDGWTLVHRDLVHGWTDIDARDANGNSEYWPSAAMAQLAAQQHYERMRINGETPDVAASRIPTDPAWYEAKMGGAP